MRISTGAGTIFNCAVNGFAAIELGPAVGAIYRATTITRRGARRSWRKYTPALSALRSENYIGDTPRLKKIGVFSPKVVIHCCVAGLAKCYKIVKFVGLGVCIKEMVRAHMVYGKVLSINAALLAGVLISSAGGISLPFPIWPAIVCVPPAPRRVIGTRPIARGAPLTPAHSIAEIICPYGVRLFLNRFTASMAFHGDALSTDTDPVDALPKTITLEIAKVIAFQLVWFSENFISALIAFDCNHTLTLPCMDY